MKTTEDQRRSAARRACEGIDHLLGADGVWDMEAAYSLAKALEALGVPDVQKALANHLMALRDKESAA